MGPGQVDGVGATGKPLTIFQIFTPFTLSHSPKFPQNFWTRFLVTSSCHPPVGVCCGLDILRGRRNAAARATKHWGG